MLERIIEILRVLSTTDTKDEDGDNVIIIKKSFLLEVIKQLEEAKEEF